MNRPRTDHATEGHGRATPSSDRLSYQRLSASNVAQFHRLATDVHVRRYLMDGQAMAREWSNELVHSSDALFETRGVGIWLVSERNMENDRIQPVGFGGFRVFEELGREPQLLYALLELYTGRGYATEIARTLFAYARDEADFVSVTAAVDGPNVASIRVLQKVGFERCGEAPGFFGTTVLFTMETAPGHD